MQHASDQKDTDPTAPSLWDAHQVTAFLGLRCKTAHTLRAYERRGLLHPIRLTARTLRYDPLEVRALIDSARGGRLAGSAAGGAS